ncbi:hypothetical protein [Echinococcus multilocularis]|uniref:Uncharacterized protein n=1 Tax=Echinococcus multilocularis TaxID=6211 RepID=U6HR73_ECHMU|nr:hypothetical protein [Echinococcus multilocularis]CUT98791.1 hypothetical protein [Echinococcus multilocularis]
MRTMNSMQWDIGLGLWAMDCGNRRCLFTVTAINTTIAFLFLLLLLLLLICFFSSCLLPVPCQPRHHPPPPLASFFPALLSASFLTCLPAFVPTHSSVTVPLPPHSLSSQPPPANGRMDRQIDIQTDGWMDGQ